MKPQQFLRTFFPNKNNRLQYLNLMNRTSAHSKELANVIEGYIDAAEKDILDEVYDMIHENDITPISTSVFEKGLAKDATYDWGADLTIDYRDDVYFISLNPNVATVTQSGVVKMLVDDANPAFAEILAVGKSSRESLLVVNNADFGIFKFNFGGGDFMAQFDKTCHLVKPNGDIVALTTGVAEACPAGVCHLIYEKANTAIGLDGMPIIGELKTLFGGNLYCYGCTSLTTLNAPMATTLGCYGCTSLTTLSAPMATYLDCNGCTSLTTLSAPMATILYCSGCTSLTTLSAPMAIELYCYGCTSLTTLSAPMATYLDCSGCTSLTTLSAPMATTMECYGCALTARSIASILADAVLLPDLSNISFDLSGGTNAPISTWSAQAIADKDYLMSTLNWTVIYNE